MRLGTYEGLHIPRPDLTVREEEVDHVLAREQRRNAVILHIDEGTTIRKVLESQPIDDTFARDFSEYDSLAEWRGAIREELEERRLASVEEKIDRQLLSMIIGDSDIPVNPDLEEEMNSILYDDFLLELEDYGMTLETYLKRSGMTEQQIRDAKREEALFAIRSEEVLREVARREHLSVLPDEVAEELAAMAEEEGEDPAVFAASFDDEDIRSLEEDLLMRKAMDLILQKTVYDD